MMIEIFEVKGFGNELPTDLDALIININKKMPEVRIKKLDVLNKDMMKNHKDVVKLLKENSLDILPLLKVNGKLVKPDEVENLIRKYI